MKFWIGLLVGCLLGAIGIIGGYFLLKNTDLGDDGIVLEFTEEEIQSRLGAKFPKSERLLNFFPVEIGEPIVHFLGESNRVELKMFAEVTIPLMPAYHAEALVTTSIRYEQADHTLRLSDVTIEDFEASSLPTKYETPLRAVMTAAARKYLNDHPVYTVDDKNYKDELVKMFLRELKVTDGKLEVRLGL